MGFEQDFLRMLEEAKNKCGTDTALSKYIGINQGSLSLFFSGEKKNFNLKTISRAIDALGAKLSFSGEETISSDKIRQLESHIEKQEIALKGISDKEKIIKLQEEQIDALKNSEWERFRKEINQYIYALARVSEGQGRSLLSIASTPWKDLHRLTPGEKDLLWKIARVILLEHPERKSTRHHIGMDRGHPHHIPHNKAEERTSCLDIYEKMARDIRIERQEDEEEERK